MRRSGADGKTGFTGRLTDMMTDNGEKDTHITYEEPNMRRYRTCWKREMQEAQIRLTGTTNLDNDKPYTCRMRTQ